MKQKEANRLAARKYRRRDVGMTIVSGMTQGMTQISGITKGITLEPLLRASAAAFDGAGYDS